MKPIAHWKTQQKLQDYASHLKAEKPENLPTGNKIPKGSGYNNTIFNQDKLLAMPFSPTVSSFHCKFSSFYLMHNLKTFSKSLYLVKTSKFKPHFTKKGL